MRRALIGHTGFVGSNLHAAGDYTDCFNSSNFHGLRDQTFDEIVCAGISAVKWLANREPERDWAGIRRLLDVLARTATGRFVLISTIDVYPDPSAPLDEDAELNELANHPYGSHRLAVERWVSERFRDHLIVRLPALFGPGLKKNALYDLLHQNQVANINPAAKFQWYPVARLSRDIARASDLGHRVVNLFPPPIAMGDIVDELFPGSSVGPSIEPAPSYNLRTKHGGDFDGGNGFVMNRDAVMVALRAYVAEARSGSTATPA
jgi:hypothetical protein